MSFSLVGQQTYSARMFKIPIMTFHVDALFPPSMINGSASFAPWAHPRLLATFQMQPEEKQELKDQLSSLYLLLAVTVVACYSRGYKFFNGIGHRQR
jgi:hypothetical protein